MIVRPDGDGLILVRQHDHARIAREIAEQLSAASLPHTPRRADVLEGIGWHDSGWETIDDEPPLDPTARPAHVFTCPTGPLLSAWEESVRIAANRSPYAGLLTSIHVLRLASMPRDPKHPEYADPRIRFERIRFQQKQIERQHQLRAQLGLATDRPLHNGLADAGMDAAEDLLRIHALLLRAMDQLSLLACFARPIFATVVDWTTGDDTPVSMPAPDRIALGHWPFAGDQASVQIAGRRILDRAYLTPADVTRAYDAGTPVSWQTTLLPADG